LTIIFDTFDNDMTVFSKEDSIELAKAILLFHEVPFCNRVKGAGVEKEDAID
jgi:hypothetical protein